MSQMKKGDIVRSYTARCGCGAELPLKAVTIIGTGSEVVRHGWKNLGGPVGLACPDCQEAIAKGEERKSTKPQDAPVYPRVDQHPLRRR